MGRIFILLGKTSSYKQFIMERCTHNQMLNCTDISGVDINQINVVAGSVKDYEELAILYTDRVYPVYIFTSDYQILSRGIDDIMHGGKGSYEEMCQTFINECKEYSSDELHRIRATEIVEGCAGDAYTSFIHYMQKVLVGDNYEEAVGGTLC